MRANRQRAFYVPVLGFLPLLGQAAVLFVGGHMVANGSLSLAEFVSFNLYLAMLIFPLRMLGMWIGEGQRATASGERIFQVIDEPEDDPRRAGARSSCRRATGASASRASRSATTRRGRSSRGSTSSSSPGKTVALIGHTGSGKTTLASLIPRFYDVQAGPRDDRRRRRARR